MKIQYLPLCLVLLFLAAYAWAGSPAEEPVARVLSREIFAADLEPDAKTLEVLKTSTPKEKLSAALAEYRQKRLHELIWEPLKKEFMKELSIEVTAKELDDFASAMMANDKEARAAYEKTLKDWETQLKKEGLPEGEKAKLQQRIGRIKAFLSAGKEQQLNIYRELGRRMVENWKVDRDLYSAFGGPVSIQQGRLEPFGAYRLFLEREEKNGKFEIYDKEVRNKFWAPYHRKQPEMPKEKVDFSTPWWLMAKPKEVNGKK